MNINSYRLKINYDKSEFFSKKIEYLGYPISPDKIQISMQKIETIAK